MSDWLLRKPFVMHSGTYSDFKIECDALTYEEIETFACLIAGRFKFSGVTGIPDGGLRIAAALGKYRDPAVVGEWLIVDDVLTTGRSMEEHRGCSTDTGVVLFARGPCPAWVHPVFQMWGDSADAAGVPGSLPVWRDIANFTSRAPAAKRPKSGVRSRWRNEGGSSWL